MVNDNGRLPYIKIMKKMQKKRNLWKNWNGDKMKRSIIAVAISFAMIAGNAYSDSIKSFDNEKDWMTYIEKNTPKEYSEMKDLSPEECREKLKTREDVEKYAIAWGSRGRFFVPLKVIDENSNTIPNITVRLTKSIGGFWTTKYKDITEYNLNGFIIVEASGCKTITIHILPGKNYYPRAKERSYYIGGPEDYYIKKGNTVIGFPIPVGFRKKGEILKLQQAGPIKFHLDKDTNKNNIFLINSWKEVNKIKKVREPYFTVDYKRDQNGKILLKKHPLISFDYRINSHGNAYRTSKISGNASVLSFDQVEFVLVSKNPDDGMIFYDTQEILPIVPIEPIAPLDGYNKKSFIIPYSSGRSEYSFFFKVGGRYGKGVISYDEWRNHNIENLYINNEKDPEKKRNLWTE